MSVRQAMEKFLVDNGLWPDEATEIVNQYATQERDMGIRWDSPTDGYPPQFIAVTKAAIKHAAIAHLKTNKPEHFALMMLEA